MAALNGFVFAYILVWILKAVIAFFMASLVLLFVALGIHKINIQAAERKEKSLAALYERELSGITQESGVITEPHGLDEAISLAHALAAASKGISASRKNLMRAAVNETCMPVLLQQALQNKSWGNRFRGLTAFYDFGSPSQFRMVLEFLSRESNTRVYGNGLMAAAASISSRSDFDSLLRLMQESMSISGSLYEGVFRTSLQVLEERIGRADTVRHVRETLREEQFSSVLKASLVHALSKEGFIELKPSVIELARRERSPVITISVMRALGIFGEYDVIIEENLGSPNRALNIVALRASTTRRDPVPGFIAKVEAQLRSSDYTIRFAAASSLKQLGRRGHKALDEASHGDDRFASEIASYVLSLG